MGFDKKFSTVGTRDIFSPEIIVNKQDLHFKSFSLSIGYCCQANVVTYTDPGVFESIGGCDALGWVDSQHAVYEVLGFRRYCVPFWSRILKKSRLHFEFNTEIENAISQDIVYLQMLTSGRMFFSLLNRNATKESFGLKHCDTLFFSYLYYRAFVHHQM